MKIILPEEYQEYFEKDIFVVRKSLNSLLLLSENELEMIKINLGESKNSLSRFILSGVIKVGVKENILLFPDGFIKSSSVSFSKEKLGLLITENKKHHI